MTSTTVQIPARGQKLRASWGASVASRLEECASEIDRLAAMAGLPPSERGESALPHPFTVTGGCGDGGAVFAVELPPEAVTDCGRSVDVDGIEEVDGRKVLSSEVVSSLSESPRTVYLFVYRPADEEDGEDGSTRIRAELSTEDAKPDGDVIMSLPVADIFVQTVRDRSYGCVYAQHLTSSVCVRPPMPDVDSIDDGGGNEGGKLQIAHFNDGERDSDRGLAGLLQVDVSTGSVSATVPSDDIMFVCRSSDGRVVYVPIGDEGGPGEEGWDDDGNPDPDFGGKGCNSWAGIGNGAVEDDNGWGEDNCGEINEW